MCLSRSVHVTPQLLCVSHRQISGTNTSKAMGEQNTIQRDILTMNLVEGTPVSQLLTRTAPWYLRFVSVHVLLHDKYIQLPIPTLF